MPALSLLRVQNRMEKSREIYIYCRDRERSEHHVYLSFLYPGLKVNWRRMKGIRFI